MSRQYHTYFNWGGKNANAFFALFGEDFAARCKESVRLDMELDASVKAFLELGNSRNEMVHENFASFPMDKTADEVFALYQKARRFMAFLTEVLQKVPVETPAEVPVEPEGGSGS